MSYLYFVHNCSDEAVSDDILSEIFLTFVLEYFVCPDTWIISSIKTSVAILLIKTLFLLLMDALTTLKLISIRVLGCIIPKIFIKIESLQYVASLGLSPNL